MPLDTESAIRLSGRKSLHLLLILVAVILGVVFFGELGIMVFLPSIAPAEASETFRTLLDASLLSVLLAVVMVPLMLYFRQRNLRAMQRALRLQYTLDQHAIVSITDVTGRITFANPRFCEISGYMREELIGQNHRLLKSGQHSPEFYREMWRTVAAGAVWSGDVCNRRKDGRLYWVHATIVPFMDARGKPEEYVAIRTEITAQKTLETTAKQREIWLRTILDNLGEGVYTLDTAGKLTYLNAEGERLIGWRFSELEGQGLHYIIHHHRPDGRSLPAAECPIYLAMRDNRIYRSNDEMFFHKDGSALPVKMTGAPLVMEGERMGSVAVFSDVRAEKLLQQRLQEARAAAEEATRLKADFLATMSHEIRTPLNGVIGMSDLLLDTPLDGEQTEFARTIKFSADALLAIINDILDFSKIEAGKLQLERTGFSLRQVIEGSLDVLASKAREKELLLASFIAPHLPDHLVGDPTRIRQILLNFLSNAIKFTERGKVMVSAEAGESDPEGAGVEGGNGGGRIVLRLAVRDSGIGLSEAAIARLFQPFSQADSSTTRKFGGTGLGLSICKRLAEAMGGGIGVDSASGAGATFWVRIPLDLAGEKRAGMPPDAALDGKRVLVIDSGSDSAAIWCAYFKAWQARCEVIPGVEAAYRRLAEWGGEGISPDVLLILESDAQDGTDDRLPETITALRSIGPWPILCCLRQIDRATKTTLNGQGVTVLQPPLKQSSALAAVLTALSAASPAAAGSPEPWTGEERRLAAADRETRIIGTAEASVLESASAPRSHRLLLAEDNVVNQRVAIRMLQKLGHEVDVVDNGARAVAAVAGGNYALVLMDCQMPEMDGFLATAAIRHAEASRGRHLPIIAMTANALQGDREQCIAAGMDDYIAKPIDAARLAAVLVAWLPRAEAEPERAAASVRMPDAGAAASTPSFSAQAAAVEALPLAIDLQRLTEMFGDDDATIDELLTVFGQSLRPLRERLRRELRDHGHNLKGLAHELRGAASNVGALPLASLAGQLEEFAVAGNWSGIEALAAPLDAAFCRIDEFIARRVAAQ